MTAAIVCSDLSFTWPDGTPVLSGLTVSFGPGRTGLIGVNGSGKSTLLRLIAGELRPASGPVRTDGEVGYLPQTITLGTERSVRHPRHHHRPPRPARHRGRTDGEEAFAAVGDDWDVEERARAWLDRLGLARLGLDDRVERLSGGETSWRHWPRCSCAARTSSARRADQQPRPGRTRAPLRGGRLLDRRHGHRQPRSRTARLRRSDRGPIGRGRPDLRREPGVLRRTPRRRAGRAQQVVPAAAADVRRERRDVADAQVKQARRDRQGRKVAESGSLPRIVANARKRHAQESAGRSGELHAERLQAARDRLDDAEQAISDDTEIRVELPATAVPAGRTVLTVTGLAGGRWHPAPAAPPPAARAPTPPATPAPAAPIPPGRGPHPRGAHPPRPGAGRPDRPERRRQDHPAARDRGPGATSRPGVRRGAVIGYLPQRLDILDDSLTVVDNVRAGKPPPRRSTRSGPAWPGSCSAASGPTRRRARCPAASGSGPCSPRCCSPSPRPSCCCSTSRPTAWTWPPSGSSPQALEGYRGALLVASHDLPFLRSAGITRWLRLDRDAGLTVIEPP